MYYENGNFYVPAVYEILIELAGIELTGGEFWVEYKSKYFEKVQIKQFQSII